MGRFFPEVCVVLARSKIAFTPARPAPWSLRHETRTRADRVVKTPRPPWPPTPQWPALLRKITEAEEPGWTESSTSASGATSELHGSQIIARQRCSSSLQKLLRRAEAALAPKSGPPETIIRLGSPCEWKSTTLIGNPKSIPNNTSLSTISNTFLSRSYWKLGGGERKALHANWGALAAVR